MLTYDSYSASETGTAADMEAVAPGPNIVRHAAFAIRATKGGHAEAMAAMPHRLAAELPGALATSLEFLSIANCQGV